MAANRGAVPTDTAPQNHDDDQILALPDAIVLPRVCSIPDCEKPHHARGFCPSHLGRWKRYGDPLAGHAPHGTSAIDKVLDRVVMGPNGCHLFTGARTEGYGRVSDRGRLALAHRLVWAHERGPIPDGLMLDHTCTNRACVRTDHLRLTTAAGNSQARVEASRAASGFRGVYARGGRWEAYVTAYGHRHYLGVFDTREEAAEVARLARLELHELHSLADVESDLMRVERDTEEAVAWLPR